MDISNIFRSKTRKELFKLFFTNPDGEYYLRELERLLAIPVSMVRKELMKLHAQGMFKVRQRGNLSLYSIDKGYPLYEEFKKIVFKSIGIQGALKEVLSKIKGVEVAFIYGSYAKDEARALSDIDLFIIGKVDESKLISSINKLESELKREINYSLYSRKDFLEKKRKKNAFISDLVENPKIFVIGSEDGL